MSLGAKPFPVEADVIAVLTAGTPVCLRGPAVPVAVPPIRIVDASGQCLGVLGQ